MHAKADTKAEKIEGGSILEVGKGQTRLVRERNDPAPSRPGHSVSGNAKAAKDILDNVLKPGWGRANLWWTL